MSRKTSGFQLDTIDETRRVFIKEHFAQLLVAPMRPVNYGNFKVLWSFELKDTTLTLTADEFSYFCYLRAEEISAM